MSDYNKPIRDNERRFLKKNKWEAFLAFKRNGSQVKKWIWLHPNYRKPCSRQKAVSLTKTGKI